MSFVFSRGAKDRRPGTPEQVVHDHPAPLAVAISGADYPGLRPLLAVSQGERVMQGQALFHDRADPAIAFVSPIAGVVEAVEFGPRRTLERLVIAAGSEKSAGTNSTAPAIADTPGKARALLLASGLWPAFRTRPFGRIPPSGGEAEAIFVTATRSDPHAADPHAVLESDLEAFRDGLALLALLTPGLVLLCQHPGADLAGSRTAEAMQRVRTTFFSGGHAAGLASTHIDRLHPVSAGGTVWTIGYQDVAAIGRLAATGRYHAGRVVALAGEGARKPRLLRVTEGARLSDIVEGEVIPAAGSQLMRVLSGSALAGRERPWLGRYDSMITIEPAPASRDQSGFAARISRIFGGGASPQPLIPLSVLDNAVPLDIMPVQLMRALAVGDAEAARRLGCLALVEEDVAVLSRLCTSGADYGVLLRHVLDELAEAA